MMRGCWIEQEFDKLIDANAERSGSVLDYHNRLEWIDHDQLEIERTGFGEFYKAYWKEEEVEVRLQYINEKNFHEVLIRINNYLNITDKQNIIRLFGFSFNPETNKYALVTYFENVKFLEQHLLENTLDLDEKLCIIIQIAIILENLNENHISLNLNSQNFLICTDYDHVMFSIFTGLEREYGIAYTAPEILQENNQSSDIYSILYRITFEQKPYNNDDIINVFRSKFLQNIQDIQDVQHLLEELIRRYQDTSPSVCPAKQTEKIVNTDVEMQISESTNDEINYAKAKRKRDDPVKQKVLNERSSDVYDIHKSNMIHIKKAKRNMESDRENNENNDITKGEQNKKQKRADSERSSESASNNDGEADVYKSDTVRIKKAKRKQMESDYENNDITQAEQIKKTKVATNKKAQNDYKKFEKARELKVNAIEKIRESYNRDLKSKRIIFRQCATALYFIDHHAFRIGYENKNKKENEVDTVGCCSLRLEHIKLKHPNIVLFDFPGKRSVRYQNEVEVDIQVYENLREFEKVHKDKKDISLCGFKKEREVKKDEKDKLFGEIDACVVNKYISWHRRGLTSRVFRPYIASDKFQELLKKYTPVDGTKDKKIKAHKRAIREVAELLNHKRTVKNKKGTITTSASQTSIRNYIDPRISYSWCNKNNVEIEDVLSKSLLNRFNWAFTKENESYEF